MRIEESNEAEINACFEGIWISFVMAAEWPRSVSWGSTSTVERDLLEDKFSSNMFWKYKLNLR